MSEQIKRYEGTCLVYGEKLQGSFMLPVEVACALAAKDARIAELEAERDALVERATSLQEKLDVAANPSEDGREVPEVVGHLLLGGPADQDELEDNDIDLDMKIVERLQVELVTKGSGVILALMTVAQHSRLVAAKDAEIARLGSQLSDAHRKVVQLEGQCVRLAQPARQVGGDEREAIKEFKALGFDFGPATPDEMNKPQEIEKLVSQINAMHQQENTAAQRAALTPAAVVMPKRPGDFYLHEPGYQRGWVAHQIEIARLNRNAIPVELLERCLEQMESDWLQIDGEWGPTKGGLEGAVANGDAEEIRELRALLGKG